MALDLRAQPPRHSGYSTPTREFGAKVPDKRRSKLELVFSCGHFAPPSTRRSKMISHMETLSNCGPHYRLPRTAPMLGEKVRHHPQHFRVMDHA
jgi:hypothetical protein